MIATMHREDVKAGLRKLFGSVAAFERVKGLPTKSVNEVLRGRANRRVSEAIEIALSGPASRPVSDAENKTNLHRDAGKRSS